MWKSSVLSLILVLSVCGIVQSHYSGPFLLWGVENLNNLKIPTLQAIDDQVLRDIFSSASSIVIFIRNSTTKLNYENFPQLSDIIGHNEWLYLPQDSLTSDPLEFNVNAEVFTLTGPVQQQDNEIAAFYRDAQINFGNKNVLGILATRNENFEHLIAKRAAPVASMTTTENPEVSTTPAGPDEPEENLIYLAAGKGLFITKETPILTITGEKPKNTITYELKKHLLTTADERENEFRLRMKFIDPQNDKIIFIAFVFTISAGNWRFTQVIYTEDSTSKILDFIGTQPPSAPLGFSFACHDTFVFRKENITLTLKNIQVQPRLNDEKKFGRAYDCVGFMSPAILSGIFVTFLLLIALTFALTAIMDIRTPNKFESRSSKQLTFTVQE